MAVTALLELQLKPDAVGPADAVLHATLRQTRARPGCVAVTVLVDRDDPAHLVVHEVWESFEADRAYRAWRQTPEGASQLGPVLAGPPKLTVFDEAAGV